MLKNASTYKHFHHHRIDTIVSLSNFVDDVPDWYREYYFRVVLAYFKAMFAHSSVPLLLPRETYLNMLSPMFHQISKYPYQLAPIFLEFSYLFRSFPSQSLVEDIISKLPGLVSAHKQSEGFWDQIFFPLTKAINLLHNTSSPISSSWISETLPVLPSAKAKGYILALVSNSLLSFEKIDSLATCLLHLIQEFIVQLQENPEFSLGLFPQFTANILNSMKAKHFTLITKSHISVLHSLARFFTSIHISKLPQQGKDTLFKHWALLSSRFLLFADKDLITNGQIVSWASLLDFTQTGHVKARHLPNSARQIDAWDEIFHTSNTFIFDHLLNLGHFPTQFYSLVSYHAKNHPNKVLSELFRREILVMDSWSQKPFENRPAVGVSTQLLLSQNLKGGKVGFSKKRAGP